MSHEVQGNDFPGAAGFVSRYYSRQKRHLRWWGRDNLGKIPGIGKDWSYGKTFILKKYSTDLTETVDSKSANDSSFTFENNEEIQLETILARSSEANVLLVGEGDERKMAVVEFLARKILHGGVFPTLEDKHIVILDGNALVASNSSKSSFENELLRLLKEANKAGNIILLIKDLPAFMSSASTLGSDLIDLIDPYLRSSDIQIVAFSDPSSYHNILEKNERVMERFEKVSLKERTTENLTLVLENQVYDLEKRYRVFFTYGAMEAIVTSADRYFTGGVEADKVSDLAIEIIPEVVRMKKKIILREDVMSLVGVKTGIPVGEIGTIEKQKLLNLESVLHERIIGQDEAIKAISNAMRRARSGIGNPNRPMGSFLFLGPTGVGKTETTKALADVFFGKEDTIMRLDMSEYNSDGALDKLIGSFTGGKAGVLTSMLREKPYGVLLLDEFEKTEKKVHDLFLQILDEGIFSDMLGKKVNARNTIIIATSNAGSDLIWEIVKSGKNLEKSKDEIIDTIVRKGIFKPELLNRFDGVILFHPLLTEDLKKVARLMLGKLEKRLEEKGLELEVNDDLINYLVEVGSDPKFGARPINRAIQETVEKVIADKMIAGTISAGAKIILNREELR